MYYLLIMVVILMRASLPYNFIFDGISSHFAVCHLHVSSSFE